MLLYKAVESLNLNEFDKNGVDVKLNKHAILEESMKLYRKLQRKKKSHRSVLDTQMLDIRLIQQECPINLNEDKKGHLLRCLVGKMIRM